MRVAVTGASGLIGSALVTNLRNDGHDVARLVRHIATRDDEVSWNPQTGDIDIRSLAGVDAVVHLAGAGIADRRWTASYKKTIRDSRVLGTRTIATALAELDSPPAVLVTASAIGYYGDRGSWEIDESADKGTGFLSDVVSDWEAAASPARAAGIRVVHARTGNVVSSTGGALPRMMAIFRLGIGGRLGTGHQYWSFISLRDEVGALRALIDNGLISGPVNLVSPNAVTNRELTTALGRALHRPTVMPVPKFALSLVLGELANDAVSSQRVIPAVLAESGFEFADPTVEAALDWAINVESH